MDKFLWALVPVALFIAFIPIVAHRFRNALLDKLPLLPDEVIQFDDACHRVEAQTGPRVALFPHSVIRVTNFRIIVAQKMLLRSTRQVLRFVAHYRGGYPVPTGYGGGALKRGYVTFATAPERIFLHPADQPNGLTLTPTESPAFASALPVYVRITTERIADYRRALGI